MKSCFTAEKREVILLNKLYSYINVGKYSKPKYIWVKVLNNGTSKICGRQPLKNLKRSGLLKQSKNHQESSPTDVLKESFCEKSREISIKTHGDESVSAKMAGLHSLQPY